MNFSLMNWDQCKRDFVRNVQKDENRVKSIIDKAKKRMKRVEKEEVTLESISFIIEDYYEAIKELLVAYMLCDGMRSSNYQCLFFYFYLKNPNYHNEALFISQLAYFRNRSEYYGEEVPLELYNKNKKRNQECYSINI